MSLLRMMVSKGIVRVPQQRSKGHYCIFCTKDSQMKMLFTLTPKFTGSGPQPFLTAIVPCKYCRVNDYCRVVDGLYYYISENYRAENFINYMIITGQ